MNAPDALHKGGCLCGGVRYEVRGPMRAVTACHCSQCRRTSGHYAAMTSAASADLVLTCSDTLAWYASSASANRGFCKVCGSNLFWKPAGEDSTSITAGTLDLPTGLAMGEHIFVGDKGDYYGLDDGLPKKSQWM
jgi:hypothetical protein